MKEPSLQKTTALSIAFHLTAILMAIILLRQSNHIIPPSPYTVSIVGPEVLKGKEKGKVVKTLEPVRDATFTEVSEKEMKKKSKKEEETVKEKISALEAKKKVEQMVRLRSIISLRAGNNEGKEKPPAQQARGGTLFDDYYEKIRREIWKQWVFPDTGQKNLEAIISIRIKKDGTIISQRIEKSSGKPLFDRSAMKALTKASPLSPPPYEMEIGVRFYP